MKINNYDCLNKNKHCDKKNKNKHFISWEKRNISVCETNFHFWIDVKKSW